MRKTTRNRNLTEEEREWIRENASEHTVKQMAHHLKCGLYRIRTFCNREKIDYVRIKSWFRKAEKEAVIDSDYFDVDRELNWVV